MHIIEIAKELEKYDWYEKNLYFKFTDYPDIVNLVQMRKMLGGISKKPKRIPTGYTIKGSKKKAEEKVDGVTQFIFKDRSKSDSGYRTLPLFDFIVDLLKEYKNKYEENKKVSANVIENKLALDTKKQIT